MVGSSNLSLVIHAIALIGIYSAYGVLQEGQSQPSLWARQAEG